MTEFALTLAGSLLLCLSMRKHWRQILGDQELKPGVATTLRSLGFGVLLIAAIVASIRHGVGVGLTVFFAHLTVAVFGIAVALPYWYRRSAKRARSLIG